MDNIVSVLAVNINAGQLAPCVKILRGIYIASQQRAQFSLRTVYQYTSGGKVVNTGTVTIPVVAHSIHQQLDPLWLDVHGPAGYMLPAPVDPGTKISCTVRLAITDLTTGALIDASYVDTKEILPTYSSPTGVDVAPPGTGTSTAPITDQGAVVVTGPK